MAKLTLSLGLVVLLHLAAVAQVDTLRLEQTASIIPPENTWTYWVAHFPYEFSHEIVGIGPTNVFVWELPDSIPIWTSPTLGNITGNDSSTVKFYDMNNDGDLDLCIQDNQHLWIFDVMHSTIIWTSPPFAGGTNLFAIGDRNSDGYEDVVMVHRTFFNGDASPDSAWINFYDGPNYQLSHTIFMPLTGYWDGLNYAQIKDNPTKVVFEDISEGQALVRKLLIYSDSTYSAYYYDGAYFISINHNSGNLRIVDPNTFEISVIFKIGKMLNHSVRQSDNGILIHAYTQESEWVNFDPGGGSGWLNEYLKIISPGGIVESRPMPRNYYDHVAVIGDFKADNPGDEICIVRPESLSLYAYPGQTLLWSRPISTYLELHRLRLARIPSLFSSPQIICDYPARVINGYDGNTSAVFEGTDPLHCLLNTGDNNDDGDDELFLVPSSRSLQIYQIARITGTFEPQNAFLPSTFRLYSNYPNPFNPSTTIQYDLPKSAEVTIDIFDILGSRIKTFAEGIKPVGNFQVIWDASDQASGMYFYRIKTSDFTETKKMLLLR
jgi:hypothetical protein